MIIVLMSLTVFAVVGIYLDGSVGTVRMAY